MNLSVYTARKAAEKFFSKRFDFFIEKTEMQRYPMSIVANYKQEK